MCAHKLGASLVYATDTDPTALLIAQKNAQVNGTDVLVADSWPTGRVFDVVVANILADTLIRMADDMASITAQGGIYIASGIIEGREDTVRLYSEAAGFTCLETKKQGEWLALVFRKATS
jgi:ribosomal protein L11 methyltransferase